MAARARSARSRPLGWAPGSSTPGWVGVGAGTRACASRAWTSISCCVASRLRCRRCASARSLPGLRGSVTGSGVFARLRSSTVPPRLRFDWARTSAFAGRSFVLALTSTTSSGALEGFQRSDSGSLKWTESSAACSASESPIAAPSTRSCLPKIKCNLTSILQAFHILGFLTSVLCGIRHARAGLAGRFAVCAGDRAVKQVDRSDLEAYPGARGEGRRRTYPRDERQAFDTHQVLPQHHRLEGPDFFLREPAQAPIRLHRALVLIVARISDFECAQRREQRIRVAPKERPAAAEGGDKLPLVDEVDVAPQGRAHPGVGGHPQSLVRLRMDAEAHLPGGLHAVDGGDVALGQKLAPGGVGENHHLRYQLVERRAALARHDAHAVVLHVKAVVQRRGADARAAAPRLERKRRAPQHS